MKETVKRWVAKAEADYETAGREFRAAPRPNYDAACFHAQQCAEKLMKAVLIERDVLPPRAHDLVHLNELLLQAAPGWSWALEELRFLSRAAVDYRYPDESADEPEAVRALDIAGRLRTELLSLLKP